MQDCTLKSIIKLVPSYRMGDYVSLLIYSGGHDCQARDLLNQLIQRGFAWARTEADRLRSFMWNLEGLTLAHGQRLSRGYTFECAEYLKNAARAYPRASKRNARFYLMM